MSPRTAFLGRLIGCYCVLVSVSMFIHQQAMVHTVTALVRDASLLFLVAVIVVLAGLAMILGHNVWSGGALPVVVTLIGWTTLIKGLLLLFLSPEGVAALFIDGLRYQQLYDVYAAFSFVLGLYLVYMARLPRTG